MIKGNSLAIVVISMDDEQVTVKDRKAKVLQHRPSDVYKAA